MDIDSARLARRGGPLALAEALRASRADTLAIAAIFEAAGNDAATRQSVLVPLHADANPPLWELGHIGWYQSWWIGRNSQRARGADADPEAPRRAALAANGIDADMLYDSGRVAHASRWQLPLPDAAATRADLALQLEETLALLAAMGPSAHEDRSLYFHRLVLLHEDMHHEAALYLAQSLGIAIDTARWQPVAPGAAGSVLAFEASALQLGSQDAGFAFDNELAGHEVTVAACCIDSRAVRWADYLPFIEAGGYNDEGCWSLAGRRWLNSQPAFLQGAPERLPRYLRRAGSGWQQRRWNRWLPLDTTMPASHLTHFEAEAWCAWAGRRLPSEAEWERAAAERPRDFYWGEVWEWTSSPFAPYPDFKAHPYRDYSAPWFDGRPVLRGASFMTQPRLRDLRYRNYFTAGRNDVCAGFRSCAV